MKERKQLDLLSRRRLQRKHLVVCGSPRVDSNPFLQFRHLHVKKRNEDDSGLERQPDIVHAHFEVVVSDVEADDSFIHVVILVSVL